MKSNPAKKNRTRQATAAVLALALGAAVYLNWSFARAAPQDLTVGAIADGTAQEVSAVIDPLTDDTAVETAAAVDTTDTQAPTGKIRAQSFSSLPAWPAQKPGMKHWTL